MPPEYIFIDHGLEDMEPKSERMSLPQWDGDPSGWRDYQQARTSKSTGQLQRDWLAASEEQHYELVLR